MIEYIEIKGYQSHTNTRIDLTNGLTAIKGLSMEGKTAILRAFEKLRTNRPLGQKFRYKYDDMDTSIVVGIDAHKITYLTSSRSLNNEGHKTFYIIDYPDGTTRTESAFGTTVPDEVSRILNISDISIQKQLDPYLLILSKSSQIAKTINKITGIDASDEWIKEINRTKKAADAELKVLRSDVRNLEQELTQFQGIDDILIKTDQAIQLENEYNNTLASANAILDLVEITKARTAILATEKSVLNQLKGLLGRLYQSDTEITDFNMKNSLCRDYFRVMKLRDEAKVQRDILSGIFSRLSAVDAELETQSTIRVMVGEFNTAEMQLAPKYNEAETAKADFNNLLIQAGKCYVCGSDTSKGVQP